MDLEIIKNGYENNKFSCSISWCEKCKLNLSRKNNNENVFKLISTDLNISSQYNKYLPASVCVKEYFIHKFPMNWMQEMEKVINDVNSIPYDESFDYILNNYGYIYDEIKKNMNQIMAQVAKFQNNSNNNRGNCY